MAAQGRTPRIRRSGEETRSPSPSPKTSFSTILFDDLELPDLVKSSLTDVTVADYRRAGYSTDGTTPNLNVLRTMRTSMSRRLALRRTRREDEIERLEEELAAPVREQEQRLARPGRQRARGTKSTLILSGCGGAYRANSVHRPDRRAPQPVFAGDDAARQGGDVLPDGRLGLDGRAREGLGQTCLHPAALVPQAQIRARRSRLHPPHARGRRGRRAGVFLRPRVGWNRRQHGARENDRNSPAACVPNRRLERLLRTGFRLATIREAIRPAVSNS